FFRVPGAVPPTPVVYRVPGPALCRDYGASARAAATAAAKRIARDLDETGKAVRLPQLADATTR
ncbi:MAG: hypothetical protein WBN82_10645, partial [Porticoccaceae bacterium]